MQLEFATIPPYLCAQWSIKEDPNRIEATLHEIVSQEMSHLALAGNVLSAVGGVPKLAFKEFIPVYPAHELPGGIVQPIPIDLSSLTRDQIEVFMQIEHPDFPPVALLPSSDPPTSIGAFYREIVQGLKFVRPEISNLSRQIPVQHFRKVTNLQEAIETLEYIAEEGEGILDSPSQPPFSSDRKTLAHYYSFKELYLQRRLILQNGHWVFEGNYLELPKVYMFRKSELLPESNNTFSQVLSKLLIDLESCWSTGNPLNVAAMFELSIIGKQLIKAGIQPDFRWNSPAT
jgi:hypothetical protein